MLAHGSTDHPAIEEDFGGVGDAIEDLHSIFVLLAVVVRESQHPGLDFLKHAVEHTSAMGLKKQMESFSKTNQFYRHDGRSPEASQIRAIVLPK